MVPQDEAGSSTSTGSSARRSPDTLVYTCGPSRCWPPSRPSARAWPPGSLHLERFSAKPQETGAAEESFELVLQRSGLTLQVPPDRSVFDVVREAGVSVLGSCLEGICGTCETEVVDGDVDHRDSILDDEERASNEVMMICVSRCRSAARPDLAL